MYTRIKNCLVRAVFCEVELGRHPQYDAKEDYEAWIAIDNDNPVTAKFIQICQKFCEKMQNNEDDQEDEEIFTEKSTANAEIRNTLEILKQGVQQCSDNFQKQYE